MANYEGPGWFHNALKAKLGTLATVNGVTQAANVAAAAAQTQVALTMVANVSGATEVTEIPDSSATVTQAEYRVLAKSLVLQINAALADVAELRTQLNAEIAALKAAKLQASA